KELNVKEGDTIAAGDLLILLDGTQASASLGIILGGLDELGARKARLEAESEGSDSVVFPAELLARAHEPHLGKILSGEQTLFALRQAERAGQKRLLRQRIAQLADIRTKLAELQERKTAAQDQLDRLAIRAPQSGIVHELAVHTIGGVVQAAEPLMLIIPSATALAVDARIAPGEIDRLHVGQKVALRFSSFNQRTTPEIDGRLTRVSADVMQDE